METPIAQSLREIISHKSKSIPIELDTALIKLLSEQLYQSPLKAIEELVVNSYDANATKCRVFSPQLSDKENQFIAVFDDGIGMNYEGLTDLWLIGRSKKRAPDFDKRINRQQIGKFGIGKLATSTISNQLTYISKADEKILGITIDFRAFRDSSDKESKKTNLLPVYEISDLDAYFESSPQFQKILRLLGLKLVDLKTASWTIAILENLKKKAETIKIGTLKWVLSTAMPISTDFKLYLNDEYVESSKENYEKLVEFKVSDIPVERLNALNESTGDNWEINGENITSDSFPKGIWGNIFVTRKSLYGQKSDDILRSHGFFVKVRDRLVNEMDPLFGLKPVVYDTLNRFHADIHADDLDDFLTASRDTIEESSVKGKFRDVLREIFKEADARYKKVKKQEVDSGSKKEGSKELVAPELVEEPLADAIISRLYDKRGSEASEKWFYLLIDDEEDINRLIQDLYTTPRSKYEYEFRTEAKTDRLVKFDPVASKFWINSSHEFVMEYEDSPLTRQLLEDFVTSEMLLEV